MSPHRTVRLAALVVPSLAALLAGCGDVSSITATAGAPGIGIGIGGGTGGAHPSALVGRWSRVSYHRDGGGALHSSEMRWEFLAGGAVTRTIVTTNITFGLQDVETREGSWTATATEIVVAFSPPAAGTTRLRWQVDRSASPAVLWLDDARFERVG
jgi:hypothetical protein